MEHLVLTALTIGFLGSTHCVGMCGGIVGALNASLEQSRSRPALSLMLYHFSYNAGRILSYAVAGAAVGLIGAQAGKLDLDSTISVGNLIAGFFMIALGLYLLGWGAAIAVLERAGAQLWKLVEPLGRRFHPVRSPMQAFGLGLVWGWLPCGLVYSALALAMVSASPLQGGLIMISFGLGTLPVLLALGNAVGYAASLARHPVTRRIAGAGIIAFGVYSCFTAFDEESHDHGAHDHALLEVYPSDDFGLI